MAGRKSREQIEAEDATREAELTARVEERVTELFAQMRAQMESEEKGGTAPAPVASAPSDSPVSQILSDLVVNMKKMMDPQSQKRVFSPQEMESMEGAREEMIRLLIRANEEGEVPVYALRSKVYLGERKIEPQYLDTRTNKMVTQEIKWPRIPNEGMIPVNEIAARVHAAFMASIGGASMNKNVASQFVLNKNFVMQQAPTDAMDVGNAPPEDIRQDARRVGADPIDYSKPINILGTVAAPVTPTAGARFENYPSVARNG